jgi:hypothetical protein
VVSQSHQFREFGVQGVEHVDRVFAPMPLGDFEHAMIFVKGMIRRPHSAGNLPTEAADDVLYPGGHMALLFMHASCAQEKIVTPGNGGNPRCQAVTKMCT